MVVIFDLGSLSGTATVSVGANSVSSFTLLDFLLLTGFGRFIGLVTNLEHSYFTAAIRVFEGCLIKFNSFFFFGGEGGLSGKSYRNFL